MAVVCGTMLIADRSRWKERAVALTAAAAIALAAVIPVGVAYLGARKVVGERGRQEVMDGSARLRNYLGPAEANALYGKALARFMDGERRLFPGFVAIALAIVALWPGFRVETSHLRLAYLLGMLLALDVSLGFNGFTYPLLYDYFLPIRALRVPARMGLFVGFSIAGLAGYGVAYLASRATSATMRRALFATVSVLMLAEYASKPIELAEIRATAPEVYADIVRDRGDAPRAALFEFPASTRDDPTYLYYSTFHWQNLINGYSGFFPPPYMRLLDMMRGFPNDACFEALRARGTGYLVVHGERLYGNRYETLIPQLDQRADLRLVSRRPWF